MRSCAKDARRMLIAAGSATRRRATLWRAGLIALGLIALMPAAGARAATLTVTSPDDPASPTCEAGNCSSLRAAIALADSDGESDTIEIPAGEYQLNEESHLSITASMTLAGAGARTTTVRAATNRQIFVISAGHVTIADLTLTGARVEHIGAAIEGGTTAAITLERDIISGNTSLGDNDGAGVYDASSEPLLVEASTLSENEAMGGAAIDGTSPTTVVNSTLTNNTARNDGGALEVSDTTLRSDTISANKCLGGPGCGGGVNAIELEPSPPLEVTDTIIAGNTAGSSIDNCLGPVTAIGPNIEDHEDCNFKAAGGIEGDPLLSPLADNGGPTPTMLPGAGSPVIDAGNEACPPQDQRGEPRPKPGAGPCDLGAVEVLSPADLSLKGRASSATVPVGGHIEYSLEVTNVSDDPAPGAAVEDVLPAGATLDAATDPAGSCTGTVKLECQLGTLAPRASVTVTVSATLTSAGIATDFAQALMSGTDSTPADNQVSLQVTVLGSTPVLGSPTGPSALARSSSAPSVVRPVISRLTISPARFRVGSTPTALTSTARAPRGATISYSLNEPATVHIVLQRELSGRRQGGRCVALSPAERPPRKARCTRVVVVGRLARAGVGGVNDVAFSGRVGSRKLAPGTYTATLTATVAGASTSTPVHASFTILR